MINLNFKFHSFQEMSQNDRLKEVGDQVNAAVETAKEAVQDAASKVSDFFQGNPFETEVGKKIGMFYSYLIEF